MAGEPEGGRLRRGHILAGVQPDLFLFDVNISLSNKISLEKMLWPKFPFIMKQEGL